MRKPPILGPDTVLVYIVAHPGASVTDIRHEFGFQADKANAAVITLMGRGLIGRQEWLWNEPRPPAYCYYPTPKAFALIDSAPSATEGRDLLQLKRSAKLAPPPLGVSRQAVKASTRPGVGAG